MQSFTWRPADAGYQWKPAKSGQPDALVVSRPWPSREYELATHTGLFRVFAELPPEPDALLQFANRYGHLGEFLWAEGSAFALEQADVCKPFNDSLLRHTGHSSEQLGRERTETLAFWTSQITAMNAAYSVWDRIRQGEADPDLTAAVAEAIDREYLGRVEDRFGYNQGTRQAGWTRSPLNLFGLMWLQFAGVVAEGKQVRRCPLCGNWFEVAGGSGRTDKEHCSLSCRQKAYRKRKQDARALHADGVAVDEIARRLNSDARTVRGWLKKEAGGDSELPPNGRAIDL